MAPPKRPAHRPNLEDVAARAGVSRATVSRVVNGQSSVAPQLRERVDRVIEEIGYVPNHAARALMTRRSNAIALLAAEPDVRVFSDPFFSGIVRGVSQEVNSAGLQLVLLMAQSYEDLDRARQFLRAAPVDGVLLISEHAADDSIPETLQRSGIPFVIGGRPMLEGLDARFVDHDNYLGAKMAAEHLAGLGRSRIATITGPQDMAAGVDRLHGFSDGLGGAFDANLVEHSDFTRLSGEAAAERLLARAPDFDGLFAASDLTALGALAALRRAGRRVPEDVAVVGFDDNEFAATSDPPLTTIWQDPILQGRTMVRLYLARNRPDIEVAPDPTIPDLTGADHLVLPVRLVVRESA